MNQSRCWVLLPGGAIALLGQLDRHRQPLARGKRGGGLEPDDIARLFDQPRLIAGGAMGAGIQGGVQRADALRQPDGDGGAVDREQPFGAGGVPIDLVMVLKEAHLPVGAIGQHVFMLARLQIAVGIAQIDAHRAGVLDDPEGRGPAVAPRARDLKADAVVHAILADQHGEIAKDAAPDLVGLAQHANGLSNLEGAVCLHPQVAVEMQDAFLGPRRGEAQQHQRQQYAKETHQKLTRGSSSPLPVGRVQSSGPSKKPKRSAMMFPGKLWTLTFITRTAPLK